MSVVTEALQQFDWSDKNILVACSGGVDSMSLLNAFIELKLQPTVLHVNYHLRDLESDLDEALVRNYALEQGLAVQIHHCPVEVTKKKGVNLQSAARSFRRALFDQWMAQSPKHVVVLAHHANDQVETFFLQLLRGSGTFGLGGMHTERGQLIRPFLALKKEDLVNYALENKLNWREDKSNASTDYLRNLFRNELLPFLMKEQPDLSEQVLFFMQLLRDRQAELKTQIKPLVKSWQEEAKLQVNQWITLTEEEQITFLQDVDLPLWTKERFTQLSHGMIGAHFFVGETRMFKQHAKTISNDFKARKIQWDFKIEKIEILPKKFDKWTVYLDEAKLAGPLYMRSMLAGDVIASVGLNGKQRISQVLKDARVSRYHRSDYPLLTDGKEILWIPGLKVSRVALANPSTAVIVKISMLPFEG